MKDQATKERFVELRAQGLSYDAIAKELDLGRVTLINWAKELGAEISNLKRIELETLQEKYFMLKKQKIELFGEKLLKLKMEIEKRDFSDIPTDKLFDLFFKTARVLEEERVDMVFKGKESMLDFEREWQG